MRSLQSFISVVFSLTSATAATSNVSLEWPYSVFLADLVPQVEQCTKVSGYHFRNNTQPNVQQLARMCGDPSCGNITTALMTESNTNRSDQFVRASFAAAYTAFTVPMLDFCCYVREPNTPCTVDPMSNFLAHPEIREKDANCARVLGYSLLNQAPEFTTQDPCPPDCGALASRFHYLYLIMPCAYMYRTNEMLEIFKRAYYLATICYQRKLPVSIYKYTYEPGWPLPPFSPDSISEPPPTFDSSGSDASTSGSADAESPSQVDSVEVGDVGSLAEEDDEPSTRTSRPITKPTAPIESPSSPDDEDQESRSGGTTPVASPQITDHETPTPLQARTTVAPDGLTTDFRPNRDPEQVVGITAFCLLVAVCLIVFVRRRRSRTSMKKATDRDDSSSSYSTLDSPSLGTDEAFSPMDGAPTVKKVLATKYINEIRMIGTGGYGVVYLVRDTLNNRLLASKRLVQNQIADDNKINGFFDEIRTVSKLHHPCIVEFVGATWTNRTDVQALFEYMDGGDLRTYLEATPVTSVWTSEKLTIVMDIADALVYVHSELPSPLVHRDLKSRNVLLSKSPLRAKLSDFGVAREVSQNESMTNGVGTSRWLAPEVILGRGDYGTACDIYSFGVVLSELDTHKIPFWDCGGDGLDSMLPEITIMRMVALEGRQPSFSASCPPKVRGLARQCLSHDPQERPTAAAIASTLREIMSRVSNE